MFTNVRSRFAMKFLFLLFFFYILILYLFDLWPLEETT